jgi:dynein assembly factor 1
MDRLNSVAKYFNEKERKRLNKVVDDSDSGFPTMSHEEIKLSCLENNGYDTPELNDKIYLHFRGFKKIENLEAFTGCKSLWLDSNGYEHTRAERQSITPLVIEIIC